MFAQNAKEKGILMKDGILFHSLFQMKYSTH